MITKAVVSPKEVNLDEEHRVLSGVHPYPHLRRPEEEEEEEEEEVSSLVCFLAEPPKG
jgi:hypothetical protein